MKLHFASRFTFWKLNIRNKELLTSHCPPQDDEAEDDHGRWLKAPLGSRAAEMTAPSSQRLVFIIFITVLKVEENKNKNKNKNMKKIKKKNLTSGLFWSFIWNRKLSFLFTGCLCCVWTPSALWGSDSIRRSEHNNCNSSSSSPSSSSSSQRFRASLRHLKHTQTVSVWWEESITFGWQKNVSELLDYLGFNQ